MKILLITGAVLLALAIIIPIAIFNSSDAGQKKFAPNFPDAQVPVKATVALSLAQVRLRLIEKLGAQFEGPNSFAELSHPEYGPQFAKFTVLPNEHGNIDGQFRFTDSGMSSDAPISTKNLDLQTQDSGLPSYLQLPIPKRKHDLQIEARSNWTTSDLQKNGTPLPYNSNYLVHFEALKPDETEITVLGLNATVVDGKRWSVIGDVFFTAPRRVDNVLQTPPAPRDKRAMLENLLKLLK